MVKCIIKVDRYELKGYDRYELQMRNISKRWVCVYEVTQQNICLVNFNDYVCF